VSQVYSVTEKGVRNNDSKAYSVVVIRLFDERNYGFVHVRELAADAFFHFSVVPGKLRKRLAVGQRFEAEINKDPRGRGFQVRRVVSLDSIS
jgi:cold shock CspA family protein